MPYFDRFDICAAYYCLSRDNGRGTREKPIALQLQRINFRPSGYLYQCVSDSLTGNARAIYDLLVTRYNLPKG